jgi:hemolysin activation/secretion protein
VKLRQPALAIRPRALHGLALACLLLSTALQAQQRPDGGVLLDRPSQLPALPAPGAPNISVPQPVSPTPGAAAVSLVPAAFRFEGNTVFDSATLQGLLASRVGQPTDLAGLTQAAQVIRDHYRAQGYLLSDAFIPAQQFSARGGTVTISVLEARIGRASVKVEGDEAARRLAESVLAQHLRPGDLITAYSLEKPVLLLRDMAGFDASAAVEPGQRPGEADVVLQVKPAGMRLEMSLGLDNFGVKSSGTLRAFASGSLVNASGRGDVLSGRVQLAEVSGSRLFRLGYSLPVGGLGTRLSLDLTRSEYALGREFAALGATGVADIVALTAVQPLYRARERNLFLSASVEQKRLRDETRSPVSLTERRIDDVRLGLLGNFGDSLFGEGAFNSYALSLTMARLGLDATSLAADQGPGGLNTEGRFAKTNIELQRVQYLSRQDQVQLTVQAQSASRNLPSAEKMVLGGPAGVRGYGVGEGAGDSGAAFSLEYRHLLPAGFTLAGEPLTLSGMLDGGVVRVNQDNSRAAAVDNQVRLGSLGVGLVAGRTGNYLFSGTLARALSGAAAGSSEPNRRLRLWLSLQKWL